MFLESIFLFFLLLVLGTIVWASLSAAPWLPASSNNIKAAISLVEIKRGDIVFDLGSGDGRWLTAVAKDSQAGQIIGVEISLFFYLWSRIKILFSNCPQVKVKYQNLFNTDLAKADVVFCFLLPKAMAKLEAKFNQELKPGAKLISCCFQLPKHQPAKIFKVSQNSTTIYLYQF